jgi:hypothetical protein
VTPSRLYLAEEGFGPRFLELAARAPGDAGNAIEVTARPAGPGRFDITVALRGARFESARAAVLGRPPAPRPQDALAPGAIGLRVTRAAGIACEVVRVDTGTPVADAAGPDAAGPDAAGPDAAGPDPAPPSVREGLVPVTAPHPVPPPTADIDKE